MSEAPSEIRYLATHEWARLEEDGSVTVGITDHAQDALGDVVYVELPEEEQDLSAGDEAGVVESVKAASDIYAPVSGTVIATNELLDDDYKSDYFNKHLTHYLHIRHPENIYPKKIRIAVSQADMFIVEVGLFSMNTPIWECYKFSTGILLELTKVRNQLFSLLQKNYF